MTGIEPSPWRAAQSYASRDEYAVSVFLLCLIASSHCSRATSEKGNSG